MVNGMIRERVIALSDQEFLTTLKTLKYVPEVTNDILRSLMQWHTTKNMLDVVS